LSEAYAFSVLPFAVRVQINSLLPKSAGTRIENRNGLRRG
jgi:hypothetical protein